MAYTVKQVTDDGREVTYNSDGFFHTLKRRDGSGPIIAVGFEDGKRRHFLDSGEITVINPRGEIVGTYKL